MALVSNVIWDSGWCQAPSSKPDRGLHDYYRTVQVKKELSEKEIKEWEQYLDTESGCPAGQTRPYLHMQTASCNGFLLHFNCSCDSSG